MRKILAAFLFCAAGFVSSAQIADDVLVVVSPDHADWNYELGEKVGFDLNVFKWHCPVSEGTVNYELSEDMAAPFKTGELTLKNGKASISTKGLKAPGFIRCKAWVEHNGKTYRGTATAAFAPEKILPEVVVPEDFDKFWTDALDKIAGVPLLGEMEYWPQESTRKCDAYKVSWQNDRPGSRMFAALFMPKDCKGKKLPAIVSFPGAGLNPRFFGHPKKWAEQGYIVLSVQIHGLPNVETYSNADNIANGPLRDYAEINLYDKDKYYYKRVYTGCVRSIDFLETLPEYDGRVVTEGSSQGGALSIVTAALDKRVMACLTMHPALCNMTHRAACWPWLFRSEKMRIPLLMETFRYFDTTCFARKLDVPVYMTLGYNDVTCPPTSTYSAYNVMTAPKTLEVHPQSDHNLWIPEMWDFFDKAIYKTLPLE